MSVRAIASQAEQDLPDAASTAPEGAPGPTNTLSGNSKLGPDSLSALRQFFELLDEWDLREKEHYEEII